MSKTMKKLLLLAVIVMGTVACQQGEQTVLEAEIQEVENSWQDSLTQVDSKEPNAGRYATPVPRHGLVKLGTQDRRTRDFNLIWSEHISDVTILVVLAHGEGIWHGEHYDSQTINYVRDSNLIDEVYFTGVDVTGTRITGDVNLVTKRDELLRNNLLYAVEGANSLEGVVGDEFYLYYADTRTYIKFKSNTEDNSGGSVESYVSFPFDANDEFIRDCIENHSYTTRLGDYRIEYGVIKWQLNGEDQPDLDSFEQAGPTSYWPSQFLVPSYTNTTYRHPSLGYSNWRGVLFFTEADIIADPNTSYYSYRRICTGDPVLPVLGSLENPVETADEFASVRDTDSIFVKQTSTGAILRLGRQCGPVFKFAGDIADGLADWVINDDGTLSFISWLNGQRCASTANINDEHKQLQYIIETQLQWTTSTNFGTIVPREIYPNGDPAGN
ncbi:hypothetical protein [Pelagibaculum spongiae]|uniref:Uncharacterized protein n=1 Tax=Pelagibaculum spongiae TaxID=2080658 RepID=A0A2V1H033_9GAMM|nr:hypothetical protein [Pelagibaculum spongiae]PVZ71823.1 hypothetical protein DC094_02005 [Pelagibaculum spongiae]